MTDAMLTKLEEGRSSEIEGNLLSLSDLKEAYSASGIPLPRISVGSTRAGIGHMDEALAIVKTAKRAGLYVSTSNLVLDDDKMGEEILTGKPSEGRILPERIVIAGMHALMDKTRDFGIGATLAIERFPIIAKWTMGVRNESALYRQLHEKLPEGSDPSNTVLVSTHPIYAIGGSKLGFETINVVPDPFSLDSKEGYSPLLGAYSSGMANGRNVRTVVLDTREKGNFADYAERRRKAPLKIGLLRNETRSDTRVSGFPLSTETLDWVGTVSERLNEKGTPFQVSPDGKETPVLGIILAGAGSYWKEGREVAERILSETNYSVSIFTAYNQDALREARELSEKNPGRVSVRGMEQVSKPKKYWQNPEYRAASFANVSPSQYSDSLVAAADMTQMAYGESDILLVKPGQIPHNRVEGSIDSSEKAVVFWNKVEGEQEVSQRKSYVDRGGIGVDTPEEAFGVISDIDRMRAAVLSSYSALSRQFSGRRKSGGEELPIDGSFAGSEKILAFALLSGLRNAPETARLSAYEFLGKRADEYRLPRATGAY